MMASAKAFFFSPYIVRGVQMLAVGAVLATQFTKLQSVWFGMSGKVHNKKAQ